MALFVNAVPGIYHSVIYTDDSGKHYRFSGGTLAWRNHNPGNVWPGEISKKHNQIGIAYKFAVFPDYKSGHNALIEVLLSKYQTYTIPKLMQKYAPPFENNTRKYIKFLLEQTGVSRDKKIEKFSSEEFEKLWKGIEAMESSKEGNIIEVFKITQVRKNKSNIYAFCIEGEGWVSKDQCIDLAKMGKVDLENCISFLGNNFLRTSPFSLFQPDLNSLHLKNNK